MEDPPDIHEPGLFEPRYSAFLETVVHLRPRLHRYCARMTGSVLDGEEVMQEALFQAYRKLDTFDAERALSPWLFRIAHNRCVDFLRQREARQAAEAAVTSPDPTPACEPEGRGVERAVEHLVVHLPPKERACILLKDVFDYSLEEIAELVDSTVGGVKAALSRARAKLATIPEASSKPAASEAELSLLRLYVERFNRRDWDGVRELTSQDARLRVADCFAGRLSDSPYFSEYEHSRVPWRMALGQLDGATAVVVLRDLGGGMEPTGAVFLEVVDGRIARIADYYKCPWILGAAASIAVEGAS
ncbi:MAG: sigma-70 family RNA polymerase sigma factor [Myxococcales bacterium]